MMTESEMAPQSREAAPERSSFDEQQFLVKQACYYDHYFKITSLWFLFCERHKPSNKFNLLKKTIWKKCPRKNRHNTYLIISGNFWFTNSHINKKSFPTCYYKTY